MKKAKAGGGGGAADFMGQPFAFNTIDTDQQTAHGRGSWFLIGPDQRPSPTPADGSFHYPGGEVTPHVLTYDLITYTWLLVNPLFPSDRYHTPYFLYTYSSPTWNWPAATANVPIMASNPTPSLLELRIPAGNIVYPMDTGIGEYNPKTYGTAGDIGQEIILPASEWAVTAVHETTGKVLVDDTLDNFKNMAFGEDLDGEVRDYGENRYGDEFDFSGFLCEMDAQKFTINVMGPTPWDEDDAKFVANLIHERFLGAILDDSELTKLVHPDKRNLNMIVSDDGLTISIPRYSITKATLTCVGQRESAGIHNPRSGTNINVDGDARLKPPGPLLRF